MYNENVTISYLRILTALLMVSMIFICIMASQTKYFSTTSATPNWGNNRAPKNKSDPTSPDLQKYHPPENKIDPQSPELQAELKRQLQRATEKKITDNATAAVVFHFHAISSRNMPKKSTRNPEQLYIFWSKEAPPALRIHRKITLDFEDSYGFNATMTYRRDSDFISDYQRNPIAENNLAPSEVLQLKSKLAVALVSNCEDTPGAKKRLKILKQMINIGFKLEAYGKCFRRKGDFAKGAKRNTEKFRLEIRKYKFYFSFENSYHCKEYITEKFFSNALYNLAVPVVWGAKKEDYEAVAPPRSFIFVEDFPTLGLLAKYLNYLDKNDTAYLEYFSWIKMKPDEMPQYGRAKDYCAICRALHGINIDDMYSPKYNGSRPVFTEGISRRTVPSLKAWFYGEETKECFKL